LRDRGSILRDLADAVIFMDENKARDVAREALEAGIDAYEAVMEGLAKGMEVVSDKYEREEYFVPEIVLCADAMYAGIEVLRPYIKPEKVKKTGKVVIGVVEGDIHDIGKNLVKIMLDTAGFEVYDLGRDVPLGKFIEKAEEVKADIIAMSTLMSTTMDGMGRVIEMLKEKGIRRNYKVIIGGGPISQSFADKIGADGYGKDAVEALKLAKKIIEEA